MASRGIEQVGNGICGLAGGVLDVAGGILSTPVDGIRWLFGVDDAQKLQERERQLSKVRSDLARQKARCEKQEAQLETMKSDLRLVKHREAEEATRADAAEAKVAELEAKVTTLNEERNKLLQLIAEAEAEVRRQDGEGADLRSRLSHAAKAKDSVIREAKRHAADARQLRTQLAKVTAELNAARAEIAKIKARKR